MTGAEVPWRRLSIRTFYLAVLRALLAMVPGYLGLVVLNDGGPVWVLVAGSFFGLLGSLGDLVRWQTTRYRITPDRVEMRTGWLARKHRTVGRDRIRSVDSTARGLSRLLGLRTVHIGSGEAQSSFQLNAVDTGHAERLQQELMHGTTTATTATTAGAAGTEAEHAEPETVIARLRRDWIPLNVVTVWAPLVVAGPVVGAYWFLRQFGIDLLAFGRGLLDWSPLLVVVAVLVAYPIGIAVKAGTFLLEWWRFQLVRVGTPPATALVTRRGLINTQTVSRDDERMRGIAFAEPLWWRWLHLAETKVITTGLRLSGQSPTSTVLPRIRLAEARDLAARILPDGHRPLEAPLRRHPRGALVRRLGWALWWPALLAGALLLFAVSGALPYWVVPLPFALVPPGLLLAVAAYRALGHANAAPYLVVRRGPLTRSTVALQDRAVIGWTFQQSVFQRRGNRIDVGIATAAGERAYHAYDMGVDQALTFALSATPDLAAQFLEPGTRWRDQAAPH